MILRAKCTVTFALLVLLSALNAHAASEKDKDLVGNYQWHDHLDMGAGYEFYRQDIDSADESFLSDCRFEYHGAFVCART